MEDVGLAEAIRGDQAERVDRDEVMKVLKERA